MDVRRDQESLRIQNENVAVLQRQLEESKARFEVGEITRTDVAQSEARLASSVALRQSAQGQLAVSRANYTAVVGQRLANWRRRHPWIPSFLESIDGAMDVAEKDNPQIRGAQYARGRRPCSSSGCASGTSAVPVPAGDPGRKRGGPAPSYGNLYAQCHRRSCGDHSTFCWRADQFPGPRRSRAQ